MGKSWRASPFQLPQTLSFVSVIFSQPDQPVSGLLGQRLFFLHDRRTSDLSQAIGAHSTDCGLLGGLLGGCVQSEAQQVIQRFNALSPSQKQDLLNFLRSL